MINESKLENLMLELGHTENLRGTAYIREGVKLYDAGHRVMMNDLYPAIARAANSTGPRVERCIRHSIEKAWGRGNYGMQLRYFGYSVDPSKGCPTVGEYISRLAMVCRE